MTNRDKKSELSTPLPRAIQEVADTLRRYGRIGFWVQIVLGVLAALATAVGAFSEIFSSEASPQGASAGIFFAVSGLVALLVAIYFCFRYIGVSQLLRNPDPAQRPSKQDTLREVRLGLFVNLLGLFLAIFGAQAITGATLIKIFTIPQAAVAVNQSSRFIQPVDLVVIQANVTTITAHFAGLIVSAWLLSRLSR
jgi:hypothetical protein